MPEEFDFIVVGAGSSGCVVANRLSESGRYSVLLLEAGGSDRWRFFVQVPLGYGKTYYQRAVNWMYHTEKNARLNQRISYWPRGKVLGGSSAINAMVYIRGHRQDYDDWARAGNPGWSYDEVLPYFKKSEGNACGDAQYHGFDGPLRIDDQRRDMHPLTRRFCHAGAALGLDYNEDFNGATQTGIGTYQATIHKGRRMSTARAFLNPARSRKNLTIITRAHTRHILFKNKQASGLVYQKSGRDYEVRAKKEVIVCAGAVNSPLLLQSSGVGPRDVLAPLGIDSILESPAVGHHLQDHLGVDFMFKSREPSLNDALYPWYGKLFAGLHYFATRRGPLSLSLNQGGGFFHSRAGLAQPNLQLYFSPVSYTRAPVGTRPLMNPDPFNAFMMGYSNCRPKSRGRVSLRGRKLTDQPLIEPNYLSADEDLQELLEGAHAIRQLAQADALAPVIREEFIPGPKCATDGQLIDYIRQTSWTVFHPCSTCRMGPDPENHVVDARLRVHGLGKLRVADASIFPEIVSGNTNAACIMVGEKAADMILADH